MGVLDQEINCRQKNTVIKSQPLLWLISYQLSFCNSNYNFFCAFVNKQSNVFYWYTLIFFQIIIDSHPRYSSNLQIVPNFNFIGSFFTYLGCPEFFGKNGFQEHKKGDFQKMKNIPPGIHPIYNFNMIRPFLTLLGGSKKFANHYYFCRLL